MLVQQNDRPCAGSAGQLPGKIGIDSIRAAADGEESVRARLLFQLAEAAPQRKGNLAHPNGANEQDEIGFVPVVLGKADFGDALKQQIQCNGTVVHRPLWLDRHLFSGQLVGNSLRKAGVVAGITVGYDGDLQKNPSLIPGNRPVPVAVRFPTPLNALSRSAWRC